MSKEAAQQRAETENGLICEVDVAAKPDVTLPRLDTNEGEKGTERKLESAPTVRPFAGEVVQRIFREAAEGTHPNNTPERNDDLLRMKMLADQLKSIADLIT